MTHPRRPSTGQIIQLSDWLTKNRDQIESERPTRRGLADKATQALGFAVVPSTVGTIAALDVFSWLADATGRKTPPRAEGPDVVQLANLAGQLAAEVRELRETVRNLAQAVVEAIDANDHLRDGMKSSTLTRLHASVLGPRPNGQPPQLFDNAPA